MTVATSPPGISSSYFDQSARDISRRSPGNLALGFRPSSIDYISTAPRQYQSTTAHCSMSALSLLAALCLTAFTHSLPLQCNGQTQLNIGINRKQTSRPSLTAVPGPALASSGRRTARQTASPHPLCVAGPAQPLTARRHMRTYVYSYPCSPITSLTIEHV